MKIKRLIYLAYYFKQLDHPLLSKFIAHVQKERSKSGISIWLSMIFHSLKYNISLMEYFQFGFWKLSHTQKKTWAGTGYMYEYQLKMNPPASRKILDNKILFAKSYKPFILHQVYGLVDLENSYQNVDNLLKNPTGKIVLKEVSGKCGKGVEIIHCSDFSAESLVRYMHENGFDLAEEFIVQHKALSDLSPSAVNTVRIFTQLDSQNNVQLLGCRLRISIDSPVDNLAAGNAAAPIDEYSGQVSGPAVFSDITREDILVHPITGTQIVGFQIPFWTETINLAKKAALMHPENRSIGWDIAITSIGPDLIEGNHDWCKLLWQLPVKKGLKPMLEKF